MAHPLVNSAPRLTPEQKRSDRRGYTRCPTCNCAGYITKVTLVTALEKGLKDQKFQIVSVAKDGEIPGTVAGMLAPLRLVLRKKGIEVT